jgi:hypothetical protein
MDMAKRFHDRLEPFQIRGIVAQETEQLDPGLYPLGGGHAAEQDAPGAKLTFIAAQRLFKNGVDRKRVDI